MMDCESFKAIVYEIDQHGSLETSLLDAAWGHAQNCARCGRRLARAREVTAALRALAHADEREHAPLRVEAQLLRAFRAERAAVIKFPHRNLAWWMAAAAVVTLAIAAGLSWRRVSEYVHGGAPAVASVPHAAAVTPKLPDEAAAQLASEAAASAHLRHSSRIAATSAPASTPGPDIDLAEFLPLPFADDDSFLETAEVVRIRLPESALGALGLPVGEVTSRQSVTADVVIGEDGVARAIRFISGPVPSEIIQQLQAMAFESKGDKP